MSDDYEELRQALLDGPRAGPWCLSEYTDDRDLIVCDAEGFDVGRISYQQRNGTARYIAAANPETVSRLLAEVDRLRAENERLLTDWNGLVYVLGVDKYGAALDHARALRKDKDRLDWLDGTALSVDFVADPDGLVQVWCETDPPRVYVGKTAREAIDAARAAGGEG